MCGSTNNSSLALDYTQRLSVMNAKNVCEPYTQQRALYKDCLVSGGMKDIPCDKNSLTGTNPTGPSAHPPGDVVVL